MGDESSDNEPSYKKMSVVVGTVGAVISALVALNGLTGFNPLKHFFPPSSSPAPPPTVTTTTFVPIVIDTTYDSPDSGDYGGDESTETTTETTEPPTPDFYVRASEWDGPCGYSWCSMSAIFRNSGGEGSGSATFYVLLPDANQYLARCSTVLQATAEDGVTQAGCTASSANLQGYFQSHPGSTVRMRVQVDD